MLGQYCARNNIFYYDATAWKLFVFGIFLVRIFPHSEWKQTRKTSNTDILHAVSTPDWLKNFRRWWFYNNYTGKSISLLNTSHRKMTQTWKNYHLSLLKLQCCQNFLTNCYSREKTYTVFSYTPTPYTNLNTHA